MRILFTLFLILSVWTIQSQVKTAPEGFQYFEMPAGDTTIVMKQYFLCFLKSGDNRNHSEAESAKIQEQHLAHLASMYQEGHTCITGPLGYDGEIRGIVVFKTPTQAIADSLASLDPAVKAGRLKVEIIPWWAMKGSVLD